MIVTLFNICSVIFFLLSVYDLYLVFKFRFRVTSKELGTFETKYSLSEFLDEKKRFHKNNKYELIGF